jgi:hypothetical protein
MDSMAQLPARIMQVGPGELAAVLLLDGPEQAPGLVEVGVVGPAVERREALGAGAAAAAAVGGAVGAGGVPGHADEEPAVVAVVGRPPVLRVGHQGVEVLLDRLEIELLANSSA